MDRFGKIGRRLGWVALAALLAGIVLRHGASTTAPQARAAPHTISPKKHPYDPDWPDVYRLLSIKCASCHRPSTERTDLTTYDSVVSAVSEYGEPVVVPGKPEESSLWEMVAWNADAEPGSELPDTPYMPEDHREWLTSRQQEIIRRWIERGALEYKLPQTCDVRPLLEIDFPSAKQCQACHPKQYDQWSRSMHHYAQHSPIMEAFTLTLVERTSGTIGTFCTRCHTPLGVALGENGSRRNIHRSRLSMEGVTCVVCHRVKRPYYKANVRHHIQPGTLLEGCLFGPFDDPADEKPTGGHPAAGAAHLRTSAFCGSCHDVTSPQGLRLEEAYSEWQNSPAAKAGITCQQCHMGPVPGIPIPEHERPLGRAAEVPGVDPKFIPLRRISNHTFAGPDYSLLPDTEFPHKLDWMYEKDYRRTESLTPHELKTLAGLRRSNRRHLRLADEARYTLLRNAAKICVTAPAEARPGEKTHVRVDVTSTTAGHNFPTGFTAERQAWVQITVRDPRGRIVFASGDLDSNGDLRDGHSHDVESGKLAHDKHLLNFQNKFTALTQEGTERSVILSVNRHLQPLNILRPATGIAASFGRPPVFRIAKGSLPPLETIGRYYPIHLPRQAGPYHVDVRLNYRHIPPALMDRIGIPHLKHLLEIVVIDRRTAVIHVRGE